jgi:hypothetical protein
MIKQWIFGDTRNLAASLRHTTSRPRARLAALRTWRSIATRAFIEYGCPKTKPPSGWRAGDFRGNISATYSFCRAITKFPKFFNN